MREKKRIISPSMLSCDMAAIGKEIEDVRAAGAEWLHMDVMDGVFVPNITIGVPVVKACRKVTDMFLDVHLMIVDPFRYIDAFAKAGADMITFHLESESDPKETIRRIRDNGVMAGITIKPGTPVEDCLEYLRDVDSVMIMTVEPGFSGQKFMPSCLPKIRTVSEYIRKNRLDCLVEVDGGVNASNSGLLYDAGVNVLVSGSTVFDSTDRRSVIRALLKGEKDGK